MGGKKMCISLFWILVINVVVGVVLGFFIMVWLVWGFVGNVDCIVIGLVLNDVWGGC